MGQALIRAEGARLQYGRQVIVGCLDFALWPGEFVGIVGPNGAGKSTIIKALSGLLSPHAGRIVYHDAVSAAEMPREKPKRDWLARLIAVVPQDARLPESFTVCEIVLMGRTPHLGFLQGERHSDWQSVSRAMALTDTLALATRQVGELSGGERQRVVIARALAQEPRVLLLDEPTTHLDITHQIAVLDLVRRLQRECALGVVAVFHDLNLAAQYCRRLVMIAEGRVIAEGEPDGVLTASNIARGYGARVSVMPHPINGRPMVVAVPEEEGGGARDGYHPVEVFG